MKPYYDDKPCTVKIPAIIFVYCLLIIGSVAYYYFGVLDRDVSDVNQETVPELQRHSITSYTNDDFNFSSLADLDASRNGIVMSQSISRTEEIFEDVSQYSSEEDIREYINEIYDLALSKEYDDFKDCCIFKLNCLLEYQKSQDQDLINKFNDANQIDVLAKCFDAARVKYNFVENNIVYWYNVGPS